MKLKRLAWLVGGVSAAMLLYGALVEAEKLVVRRHRLRTRRWPMRLNEYRIALIADFHIRDEHTVALTRRAIEAAVAESPNVIVIAGDFVGYWKPQSPRLIGEALEPLKSFAGKVIAVPGNHDYWSGDASLLEPICEELNIHLLRNESFIHDGVQWIGIDSLNAKRHDLSNAICDLENRIADLGEPTIVVWHEPDAVDLLPSVFDLMLSGHSHGGQFVFPGGFIPMKTKNGRKYIGGFYPNAKVPLFVTRGVGTTGPPSRFLCPPEIVLLTLN